MEQAQNVSRKYIIGFHADVPLILHVIDKSTRKLPRSASLSCASLGQGNCTPKDKGFVGEGYLLSPLEERPARAVLRK